MLGHYFMDLMPIVTLMVAAAAAVLACLAWRRPAAVSPPADLSPILARLESLDRATREEIGRNRAEVGTVLAELRDSNETKLEAIRGSVTAQLTTLQHSNEARLELMRQTVDEKLQGTLERRLSESFQLVSERLEQVHKGLGEMQSLATGVGDLKRVLTNVRARGAWGEVQLGTLLEQMLSPEQYARNVAVSQRNERVEFAIRMPEEEETVWLPIDSKFPQEDYERLAAAADAGNAQAVEECAQVLERRIRQCAKEIAQKYIEPPRTTDFAVLFLPTEGLYAEVLRRPGLADSMLRDYRVHVTGPTTLGALLTSLRYAFQRVAMQQKSAEAWRVLGAAKAEFEKYADVLDKIRKKLEEASSTVESAQVRTRAIQRSLRDVSEPELFEATAAGSRDRT